MINREVTCTVKGRKTVLSEDIFLYKGDGSVQLLFNVVDYKYRFDPENMVQKAAIKTTNMTIVKPNKTSFKTNRTQCLDDQVVFNVARDLLDEQDEVGIYQIQIHLFDLENNRITIPPFNITILDTISDVPEPNLAILNASYADKAYLSNEKSSIKGPFEPGDLLTADNLNALHKFTLDTCEGTRDYINQGLAQIKGEKEEVTNARGGLHYLKLRLERDKEEVLQIMREDLYKSFKGERITADKSVKGVTNNLVVSGRTIQNVCPFTFTNRNDFATISAQFLVQDGYIIFNQTEADNAYRNIFGKPIENIKPNSTYTLVVEVKNNTLNKDFTITSTLDTTTQFKQFYSIEQGFVGIKKYRLTSYEDISQSIFSIRSYANLNTIGIIKFRYMILEGDWTNKEIPPYFEGIQSVGEKETNLFDKTKEDYNSAQQLGDAKCLTIKLKPNTQYTCSTNAPKPSNYSMIYFNGQLSDRAGVWKDRPITTTTDAEGNLYVGVRNQNYPDVQKFEDFFNGKYYIQLQEGNNATEYIPPNKNKISIFSRGKNLFNLKSFTSNNNTTIEYIENGYILTGNGDWKSLTYKFKLEPNKKYYFKFNREWISGDKGTSLVIKDNGENIVDDNQADGSYGRLEYNFTPKTENVSIIIFSSRANASKTKVTDLILSGSNSMYEPYIEDKKEILLREHGTISYHPKLEMGTIDGTTGTLQNANNRVRTGLIKHEYIKTLTCSFNSEQQISVGFYDKDGVYINASGWKTDKNITLPSNCVYIRGLFAKLDHSACSISDFDNVLISQDSLIPYVNGLKSLPNGVCDTLESREDGIYFVKRIEKVEFDGDDNEDWSLQSINTNNLSNFLIRLSLASKNRQSSMCSKLIVDDNGIANAIREGYHIVDNSTELYIRILSEKANTVEGFKKWLQTNPITLYYELAEPIETKLYDYYSTNLQTYKDVTYVQGDNFILPEISCEIPVKEQIEG